MNEHPMRHGWAIALLVVVVTIAGGVVAYNIGLSQGLAQVATATHTTPPYPYPWHRPWGVGFVFPLLFFVFLWAVLLRGLCWRSWRPWHYGAPPYGESFEEWHRRAHERMNSQG